MRARKVGARHRIENQKCYILCTYNMFGKLNPMKSSENFNGMRKELRSSCFYYADKKKVYYNPSKKLLQSKKVSPTNIDKYTSWDSYCTLQMTSVLQVDNNLNVRISKPMLVCPSIHEKVEKNISMVIHKQKVFHQYTITPWTFLNGSCNKP